MPRPDAVLIPASAKKGATKLDRIDSILAVVEPILQVDRPKERAWIRQVSDEELFVTRDPKDTLYGAKSTPQEGKRRYRWESNDAAGVKGLMVGYLVDPDHASPTPPQTAPTVLVDPESRPQAETKPVIGPISPPEPNVTL